MIYVKTEFHFVNVKNWNTNFAALCISAEEIHNNDRKTINETIEQYISSVAAEIVTTNIVANEYLSVPLYIAIKTWAYKYPNSIIVISVTDHPEVTNIHTNKILRLSEIICLHDKEAYSPIYELRSIHNCIPTDRPIEYKYDLDTLLCKYKIHQPIIYIRKD